MVDDRRSLLTLVVGKGKMAEGWRPMAEHQKLHGLVRRLPGSMAAG